MYTQSAQLYDKLYHFKDYNGEAARIRSWIYEHNPDAKDLLDVGCATGRHLEYLKTHYECEGLDLNRSLVDIARQRSPGLTFYVADMNEFHLARKYDVITCLFGAIAMAATCEDGLRRTTARLAEHLRPGGLLIVEPWFTPEKYWTGTITANFVNEADLKIAWMYHSTARSGISLLDIHYLVGTPESIDHFNEHHELGLFKHETYLEALRQANLRVWNDPQGFGRGMYFGLKPIGDVIA